MNNSARESSSTENAPWFPVGLFVSSQGEVAIKRVEKKAFLLSAEFTLAFLGVSP
jgi:hypothetical protein